MTCEVPTSGPEGVPSRAVEGVPTTSNSVTLIGLIDYSSPRFSEIEGQKVVRFLLLVPDNAPDDELPPGKTHEDCQQFPILGRGPFVDAFSDCPFGGCLILLNGRLELTGAGLEVEILTWYRIA